MAGFALLAAGLWLANSSALVPRPEPGQTRIIAHRGVHQIYAGADRSVEACHAAPVHPVQHPFIENTIASMREAVRLGADVVEIDVHLTPDPVFAVFHDWTLECRTDGAGVTRAQDFATLAQLDVGYRIDDGTGTYPLRGSGVGAMPTLDEVFAADLAGQFLINFKSRTAEDGVALATMLERSDLRAQVWGVYGGAPPTQAAIDSVPGLRGFDAASLKACLIRYQALGWSGYVPPICTETVVVVPQNFARLVWGWPHRFTARLRDVGSVVILAGPYDGSGFLSGIDDAAALSRVPRGFDGYLWTNRVEVIGPLLAAQDP